MQPSEFVAAFRKGKAGRAYFLRGPDRFLQEECRKAVMNAIPEETRQWCLAEVEFQPERLKQDLEAAQQMPMLGEHNILLFSDPEDFKHAAEEDAEALGRYLERPSPFSTVVFTASEPDRRRKFIQLLEKKAELVEMKALNRQQAALWATEFLQQAGVEIEPTLAEGIAGKFEVSNDSRAESKGSGVNLLWMRTEIEKLLTARPGKKRLEASDLDLIVAFREEHEIGKLLRAIAERKCGQALEFLRELLGSKVAETLIVWCIGDLFRQTLRGGGAAYGGGRGGWSRPSNPYATWEIVPLVQRNYPREELQQALRSVRRTDLGIKSSWKDARILLEFLVWQVVIGKESAGVPTIGEELPAPSAEG
jgi:DNA polymerase III delta subunit